MKKLVVTWSFLLIAAMTFAQSGKRELNNAYNAYSNGYLDRALTAINKCMEYEDTKNDAKTWMYSVFSLLIYSKYSINSKID